MTLHLSWGSRPIPACGYSFVTMVAHYRLAIGPLLPVREPERPYRLRRGVILAPPQGDSSFFDSPATEPCPKCRALNGKRRISTIYDFNVTHLSPRAAYLPTLEPLVSSCWLEMNVSWAMDDRVEYFLCIYDFYGILDFMWVFRYRSARVWLEDWLRFSGGMFLGGMLVFGGLRVNVFVCGVSKNAAV